MKNFLQHLSQVQKTYEFRIKIANIDPTESMPRLEAALDAYGLESISKPKRLPIQENILDFPGAGPTELFLIDAVLKYPVTDAQLRQLIAERWGVPVGNIVVVPKNAPEEIWRWNANGESELRQYKQGESVLDKPLEDNPEGKAAGKVYAAAGSLLKELSAVKWEVAGKDNTDGAENKPQVVTTGKTLNSIPQGKVDPIGTYKNSIPNPNKGLK